MEITSQKNSPQYNFLLECIGYSFYRKKSGTHLDKWEVFAMGIRKLSDITNGNDLIGFNYTPI